MFRIRLTSDRRLPVIRRQLHPFRPLLTPTLVSRLCLRGHHFDVGNAFSSEADAPNDFLRSVFVLGDLDPLIIVYGFLPALLFGEASSLNVLQSRKVLCASTFLAFPGAVFGAWLLAWFFFAYSPFPGSFNLCFTVGTILSATDPVAVVATLKKIASSSPSALKLTYLISGEALLNDGSALVLFEVLTSDKLKSASAIAMYFVKVCFVSPLIGLSCGLLTVVCLSQLTRRHSREDRVLQIVLTVTCGYISFFLAQYVVEVSGVIACCSAGVTVAWLAPSLYLHHGELSVMWHTLDFSANTIIFMLAGVIVGRYIPKSSPRDYLSMFVAYLAMQAARLVVFAVVFPFVRGVSSGYSLSDAGFSVWAGLRGSVSLAMMLILQNSRLDSTSTPVSELNRASFVICGSVALTIVINGVFAERVFRMLYRRQLADTEFATKAVEDFARLRIVKATSRTLLHTASRDSFVDISLVQSLCGADMFFLDNMPTTIPPLLGARDHSGVVLNGDAVQAALAPDASGVNQSLMCKYRAVYLEVLKRSYMRQINDKILSRGSRAAVALFDSLDVGMESSHVEGMQDWDHIRSTHASLLRESSLVSRLEAMLPFRLGNLSWIHSTFRKFQFHNTKTRVSMLRSFIAAHESCNANVPLYLGHHEGVSSREEEILIAEAVASIEEAKALIAELPVAEMRLQASMTAAVSVIQAAESFVSRLLEDGILSEASSEALIEETEHDMRQMEKRALAHIRDYQERNTSPQLEASGLAVRMLTQLSSMRIPGSPAGARVMVPGGDNVDPSSGDSKL